MPPRGVRKGSKRAREYQHIKASVKKRGASEKRAEEIAARTVNKDRARAASPGPGPRSRCEAGRHPCAAANVRERTDRRVARVSSSTKRRSA